MHILFLNRSYPPDPEATGQYLADLTGDLTRRGEEVSVVCGRSYHSAHRRREGGSGENGGGVRVHRAYNTSFAKSSFVGRLINLGTYFLGCVPALLSARRPEVVVAATDPPLLPLLGALYARLARSRFVFLINDLYPDVGVELGVISSPFWLRLLEWATQTGLDRSDAVVVLGEDMREKVLRKGVEPDKVRVIHYWADTAQIVPRKEGNAFREEHGISDSEFVVMYSGNMGLSQPLEDVLRAGAMLEDVDGLRFVFVGEGARRAKLERMAQRLSLDDRVKFTTYQPREGLAESLSAADLHLVPLVEEAAGSIVPCKIYGIMAAGTPYLAITSRRSEAARLARRHECGMWCRPGEPEAIAEHIRRAAADPAGLRQMGRNGRRAAERRFSRRIGTERYHRLLREI